MVPGTIRATATGSDFSICQGPHVVHVVNTGSPPQLFQASIPVVVVGHFTSATSNAFVSNSILVKHSATYSSQHQNRLEGRSRTGLRMIDGHLGTIGVWLAFVASIAGAVMMIVGLASRRPHRHGGSADSTLGRATGDGRLLAPVMLVGVLFAAGAMEHTLVTHDFALVFVAENNSTVTPLLYSITGMWSALAGSILLWGLFLAVVSTIFVWRYRRQAADPVIQWATLVLYIVSAFFFGLMIGPANPFVTAPGATQGLGPNSLLQDNPLVAIHPPLLYIGFVVFTVPFAFAIGMLATGRVGERWQIECRRWTLVAFTFLSVGIVLGAWWSYQVLGWGGFWGWDPVENAALLPWLCGTAYLHSVLVQERRGLMPRLEPLAVDRHLRADHPRHVLDQVGRDHLGPRLLPVLPRPAPDRVLLRGRHRGVRTDRLAGGPPPLARRDRRPARPRRVPSSSTTCCSWASPSSCCSGPSTPCSTRPSRSGR